MTLPKRFTAEPTSYINAGGTMLPIQLLPKELIAEYAMLDKMRAQLVEKLYELELLQLAVNHKKQELVEKTTNAVMQAMGEQAAPSDPESDK